MAFRLAFREPTDLICFAFGWPVCRLTRPSQQGATILIKPSAVAFVLFSLASGAHADSVATMGGTVGDVKINQGVEFVQAEPGQAVNAGDRILVMEGGSASITYSDGCEMKIPGGSLVTVPATSTCKGAQAHSQQIAPSDSGPVGSAAGRYSTVDTVGWIWMGTAAACFVFCGSENNNNTVSP
jgi:hypothetical protein